MTSKEESTESTESALAQFRAQWREEVSKKSKGKNRQHGDQTSQSSLPSSSKAHGKVTTKHVTAPLTPSQHDVSEQQDDAHPGQTYHNVSSKDDALKLESSSEARKAALSGFSEPKTALEFYELAVEKEDAGNLGESVKLYRSAVRLDERVHEAYRRKHHPTTIPGHAAKQSPSTSNAPTASTTVTHPAHATTTTTTPPPTITALITTFASLAIPAAPPPTSHSQPPPCPIATLPTELLLLILHHAATTDPANLSHIALVCKRLAHLVATTQSLYKHLLFSTRHGLGDQHYRYATTLLGAPLRDPYAVDASLPSGRCRDLTPGIYSSYGSQYRSRPRIRFGGAYISTTSYTRAGGHSLSDAADGTGSTVNKYSWSAASPVHVVTYYRYLRFYRDGTVLSLLSSCEPAEVIPVFARENMVGNVKEADREHAGGPVNAVMREALRGRWRITGPISGPAPLPDTPLSTYGREVDDYSAGLGKRPGEYAKEPRAFSPSNLSTSLNPVLITDPEGIDPQGLEEEEEDEGTLHIETQGVLPKYLWKMEFRIGSTKNTSASTEDTGGPTRNNRLSWKGFWSYNRLTDDWGEFGLRNDRAFFWSRVRRWGVG